MEDHDIKRTLVRAYKERLTRSAVRVCEHQAEGSDWPFILEQAVREMVEAQGIVCAGHLLGVDIKAIVKAENGAPVDG